MKGQLHPQAAGQFPENMLVKQCIPLSEVQKCSCHYCYNLSLHPLPSVSLSPTLFLNLDSPMGHITKRQDLLQNCIKSHHKPEALVLGPPNSFEAVCPEAMGRCSGGDRKDICPGRGSRVPAPEILQLQEHNLCHW